MSGKGERMNNNDFYAVLGLDKKCTPTELKSAYKKLAMRWHPDRCSSTGSSKFVEEAKKKFQAIQEAYSVLSDETKRFLYDVGVYDNDDDENNHGMNDFLSEMVSMMSETKPSENGGESFEQLQELFEEMLHNDAHTFPSTSQGVGPNPSCSSSYAGSIEGDCLNSNFKRNSFDMNKADEFGAHYQSFCVGEEECRGDLRNVKGGIRGASSSDINTGYTSSRRRRGRKQKVSPGHDVSYNDCGGVSA